MYLAVADIAVSAVLFKESKDGRQRPVFFVSKSLANVETRYSHLEQAALAFRIAAKKLRPYFQAHPIVVLTNLPLRSTIHKSDLFGRMACWAIELSEHGVQYKPRLAKKGQVLADFLAEIPQPEACPDSLNWWTLCSDPRAQPDPVGRSETKPRGRSFNSFYSHFITFYFSKVSRPESPARPEGKIRTGARFTPTFSFILSNIYLCYIILGFRLRGSIFKWKAHKHLHFTK